MDELVAHFSHSPATGFLANVVGVSPSSWYHGTGRPGGFEPGEVLDEEGARTRQDRSFRTPHQLKVVRRLGPEDVGRGKPISERNWEAMGHALHSREAATRTRPNRDQKQCPCCNGSGDHSNASCDRCSGTGFIDRSDSSPNCPGQAQPRRRHWRQASATCPLCGGEAHEERDGQILLHRGIPDYGSYRQETWPGGYQGPDVEHAEIHSPGGGKKVTARIKEGDEQPFESPRGGSYTMRYRTEDQGERKPRKVIETYHPDGSVVGRLTWDGTTGLIHRIETADEEDTTGQDPGGLGNGQNHRRRGIATGMWSWGRQIDSKLRHSRDRTSQGIEWAKAVGGPGVRDVSKTSGGDGELMRHFEAANQEGAQQPVIPASQLPPTHVHMEPHPDSQRGHRVDEMLHVLSPEHWPKPVAPRGYDDERRKGIEPAIRAAEDYWRKRNNEGHAIEHPEGDGMTIIGPGQIKNDPVEEMQGRVRRAEKNRYNENDRQGETGHLVRGEMAGIGYDGEPLLRNVRRVGDWIDHRHLFIPTAEPHRLARQPWHEGYEPPEEEPQHAPREDPAITHHQAAVVAHFEQEAARGYYARDYDREADDMERGMKGLPARGPYYHGTTAEDLEEVTPTSGGGRMFPHDHEGTHAYATSDPRSAWEYAERAYYVTGERPRVYRVEPKAGDVEKDPTHDPGGNSRRVNVGDVRSRAGFDVVHEMPVPAELDHMWGSGWDADDDGHHEGSLVAHFETTARYIAPPGSGEETWQHVQEAHGVSGQPGGKMPGADFLDKLHQRFHAGEVADRRTVDHQHETPGAAPRKDPLAGLFTPIPAEELEAQRRAREPKPERLDDREYSIGDVSRHYDWEGFNSHGIGHLVHQPEHATFTHEDVPVHSLRHLDQHGNLVPIPTYHDIASQDEREHERLRELEHGYDQGASIPPIVVVRHGEHHIIADGSHRAAIHAAQGSSHIPAFVTERTIFPEGSKKEAAAMDPANFMGRVLDSGNHGMTDEDAQDMHDVLEHIRLRKGPGVPINDKDAEVLARSHRGRDRMEGAGFQIARHSQETKYPRGFGVDLSNGHRLTLVPERHPEGTNWYARIDHPDYPMGPRIEHTIRTSDHELPGAVRTFLDHPDIQAEMDHQLAEGKRVHAEIRAEHEEAQRRQAALEPAPEVPSFVHRYETQGPTGYEPREETITGPFYHGGRANLGPGGLIKPKVKPNSWGDDFDERGRSNHTYFSTDRETAASYARALPRGHLYEVRPTGEAKYDGSSGDGSYKTRHPLEVIREVPRGEWAEGPKTAGLVLAAQADPVALSAPEAAEDSARVAPDLADFFRTAADGLGTLAGTLEDTPLHPDITHGVRKAADICHGQAERLEDFLGHFAGGEEPPPKASRPLSEVSAATGHLTLYHGAHHDDVPSIVASGLRPSDTASGWTVTDNREGAAIHAGLRDWTAPKVVELHVSRDQAASYLSEPSSAAEGTVYALRRHLPAEWVHRVHEASRGRQGAAQRDSIYIPPELSDEGLEAARTSPHQIAGYAAQHQVRLDHPRLTMPFPESHDASHGTLAEAAFKAVGYPPEMSRGAFVLRHPDTARMVSNPSWLYSKEHGGYVPGVAIHPDKRDYGTVLHEAAHHTVFHELGLGPAHHQARAEMTDEESHGPRWAHHYAQGLNWMSPGAGDDFLAYREHYLDQIRGHHKTAALEDWDPYAETLDEYRDRQAPEAPAPHETEEYWHPEHLYHGTSEAIPPGALVEPGHAPNHGDTLDVRHTRAYATPHLHQAWEYAEQAAQARGGRARVYEVGRAPDMSPDPESGYGIGGPESMRHPGWQSQTGFPVLREMQRTAAVEPFDEETGEARPWHQRWEGESPEDARARQHRYVQQVARGHDVSPEAAHAAITHVAGDLANESQVFASARDYGFRKGVEKGFLTEPLIAHLMKPETWKGLKPTDVPTDRIRPSQNWLRPPSIAHNLFHQGKREATNEDEIGHPDVDPDDYRDDYRDEETYGEEHPKDDLGGHARFIQRTNGEYLLADGHHRAGTDMLLGKPTTRGVVIHEDDIRRQLASKPWPRPKTPRELYEHMAIDHERTRTQMPRSEGEAWELEHEHDHAHDFGEEDHDLDHEHEGAQARTGSRHGEYLDLYHHTSPEAAESIRRQQRFVPAENEEDQRVYFTNLPHGGSAGDYGEAHVRLHVPRHLVHEWPGGANSEGERYYDMDPADIRPEHFVPDEYIHGQREMF
jgi:hypothetical protein